MFYQSVIFFLHSAQTAKHIYLKFMPLWWILIFSLSYCIRLCTAHWNL